LTAAAGRLLLDTLALRGDLEPAAARGAWGSVDARAMAALVRWEGGSQWLLRRLRERGLDDAPPAALTAELRRLAMDEQARALLVDAETQELARYLAEHGVPSVLIKGPARRAARDRYPAADARATLDVDVLLPAPDVRRTWNELRARGWPLATDPEATPAGHYHPPPLRGPMGIAVELHASTGEAVSPAEAWRRANDDSVEISWGGVPVRVPSATELLWHGLTHALSSGPDGFRLRHFLDGAAILAAPAELDWQRIAVRLESGAECDAARARAWLRAAAELARHGLPAGVRGTAAPFDLARALAWRLAVLGRMGNGRLAARLLEEGTRRELGLSAAPVVPGTGLQHRARRWLAGRTARLLYGAWRAAGRGRAAGRLAWSEAAT
jgi:Uncharacterised nucleotidyltransferase